MRVLVYRREAVAEEAHAAVGKLDLKMGDTVGHRNVARFFTEEMERCERVVAFGAAGDPAIQKVVDAYQNEKLLARLGLESPPTVELIKAVAEPEQEPEQEAKGPGAEAKPGKPKAAKPKKVPGPGEAKGEGAGETGEGQDKKPAENGKG